MNDFPPLLKRYSPTYIPRKERDKEHLLLTNFRLDSSEFLTLIFLVI